MQIISLAGAFMALIMGSGFASGQEVLRFFTAYGFPKSLWGLLIALLILSGTGARVMVDGRRLQPLSTGGVYRYYCGNRLGRLFELAIPLVMFCFLTVMISGSGATFQEYYSVSGVIGRLFMAVIVAVTVSLGLSRLVKILGFLGIIIIISVIAMSVWGLLVSGAQDCRPCDPTNVALPKGASFSWWMSGLLYGCMNITTAIPFLAGLGKEANTVKGAGAAGSLGGLVFAFGVFIMNLMFLVRIQLVADKQIPFLWVAHWLHPSLGTFFSLILLGGIYTTAVPLLWSICDGMGSQPMTVFIVIFLAFIGSAFPFSYLVGTIYPATGFVGLFLLLCIFLKK
ncbi:MAG: hypothetical protein ACOX4U_07170 [Anaerovoracaceae bacterium]|jgi:uncharacterized membrane protein YkvI